MIMGQGDEGTISWGTMGLWDCASCPVEPPTHRAAVLWRRILAPHLPRQFGMGRGGTIASEPLAPPFKPAPRAVPAVLWRRILAPPFKPAPGTVPAVLWRCILAPHLPRQFGMERGGTITSRPLAPPFKSADQCFAICFLGFLLYIIEIPTLNKVF